MKLLRKETTDITEIQIDGLNGGKESKAIRVYRSFTNDELNLLNSLAPLFKEGLKISVHQQIRTRFL